MLRGPKLLQAYSGWNETCGLVKSLNAGNSFFECGKQTLNTGQFWQQNLYRDFGEGSWHGYCKERLPHSEK